MTTIRTISRNLNPKLKHVPLYLRQDQSKKRYMGANIRYGHMPAQSEMKDRKYPRHDTKPRSFEDLLNHSLDPKSRKFVGRSWRASELRLKSFHDLHSLWYICHHELLCLQTEKHAAARHHKKFLNPNRLWKIKLTMARIKTVIHERHLIYRENLHREKARIRDLYKILKDNNLAVNVPSKPELYEYEKEEWSGQAEIVDRAPGAPERDPWRRTWARPRPESSYSLRVKMGLEPFTFEKVEPISEPEPGSL